MNIIFMRHGEATDNVKEILSDKEIYWSTLTAKGKKDILKIVKSLPDIINKIYVSPFPRTIETAHIVYEKYSNTEIIIDNRLREINYGKYSGKKNNKELDNVRLRQINDDYFVRFGDYGENKYDIELRLCNFLEDLYVNNSNDDTILIVSHGSIISYMKRLLNIKSLHTKTGEIQKYSDVDFSYLFYCIKKLKNLKKESYNR